MELYLEDNENMIKSLKGSHSNYNRTVIVPHPKPEIPYGTFLSIVRQ